MRRLDWIRFRFAVEQLVWLDNRRFAAVVRARDRHGGTDMAVLFEGRRATAVVASAIDIITLRPSPRGRYVAVASERGVLVANRRGRAISLPDVPAHAVAWSPDDR